MIFPLCVLASDYYLNFPFNLETSTLLSNENLVLVVLVTKVCRDQELNIQLSALGCHTLFRLNL